jgi:30S ribosomal protein 3
MLVQRPAARATVAVASRNQLHRRVVSCRAAEAEEAIDSDFVYAGDEDVAAAEPAAADSARKSEIALPTYHLNVLYLDKAIGIAVDQRLASGQTGPVTEYFMWPAKDAWEQLKQALEAMPWIAPTDMIHLLNSATQVINFWQDEEVAHTIDDARKEFEGITFYGA